MEDIKQLEAKPLIETYEYMLKTFKDEKGIYPYPCVSMESDNKMSVYSFMVSPEETIEGAFKEFQKGLSIEMLFGIDRMSKEGQGVDLKFNSVFTIFHLTPEKTSEMGVKVKFGILPYNNTEFGEIEWDNTFWNEVMAREVNMIYKKITYIKSTLN